MIPCLLCSSSSIELLFIESSQGSILNYSNIICLCYLFLWIQIIFTYLQLQNMHLQFQFSPELQTHIAKSQLRHLRLSMYNCILENL